MSLAFIIFCRVITGKNSRTTSYNLLLINDYWPNTKVLHGKPGPLESQSMVELNNRDLKNLLASKMRENANDLCWVKYVRPVHLEKNKTYHSTCGIRPSIFVSNLWTLSLLDIQRTSIINS